MIIEFLRKKKKTIIKTTLIILFLASIKVGIVEYLFRTAVMEIYDLIVNIEMLLNIKADKEELLGADFRLFQDTPAWELAKAVKWQDTTEIRRQVQELHVPIDFQEEKYGETLLMMALQKEKNKSVIKLLELGADPNLYSDTLRQGGQNAVMIACEKDYISPKTLKLLLRYDGNPNSVIRTIKIRNDSSNIQPLRKSALFLASQESLEKVRILVESGADVNQYTPDTYPGAIKGALNFDKMDIVLYLLEHRADYNRTYHQLMTNGEIVDVDILYKLRQCILPLDSEQYEYKMKVVDFLQKRGLNYWDSEIPDYILKRIKERYPDDWEEYIKKY